MHGSQPIILCLASYFKGSLFLEEAKRQGAYVILVTREKIKDEAWPLDSIDERFLMPSLHTQPDITNAVSYLMREREIDRIVPLDDYDVPTAAALRSICACPAWVKRRPAIFATSWQCANRRSAAACACLHLHRRSATVGCTHLWKPFLLRGH